jgi:formylmethanofuran dehydrogenase subunit E
LKGKTLFVNHLLEYVEQGDSCIAYTVALLEKEGVSVVAGRWFVYEDEPQERAITSIAYAYIREVKLTETHIAFGGAEIEIPDEQMFEYQDTDPDDPTSFSTSRTSDVRQFAVALRKMKTI